jgi:hypothetical protein
VARGIKESVLIGGGAMLVLLTVLLLVSLRQPAEQEETEPGSRTPPVPAPAREVPTVQPGAVTPAPVAVAPPAPAAKENKPAPPLAVPELIQERRPPLELREPPSRELVRVSPAPSVSRLVAPMSEPPELENEPDPKRREMLRRMHHLAEAKMRQGVFSRRANMLEQSLAEAQASGTWSEAKIKQAEKDLKQLDSTLKAAGTRVDELKRLVDEEIK